MKREEKDEGERGMIKVPDNLLSTWFNMFYFFII